MSGLHFGSVSGPQNGGRLVGKILITRRKIAQVAIVSAGTRHAGSHGFAAPQALVLHTLRTCMSTHVLELFKNMCGHKRSQGVENNCSRRCETMETQRYAKLPSRTCGNSRNLHYFSPGGKKFCRQNGPRFGVQKRTPKRGPSRPDTSKSN